MKQKNSAKYSSSGISIRDGVIVNSIVIGNSITDNAGTGGSIAASDNAGDLSPISQYEYIFWFEDITPPTAQIF